MKSGTTPDPWVGEISWRLVYQRIVPPHKDRFREGPVRIFLNCSFLHPALQHLLPSDTSPALRINTRRTITAPKLDFQPTLIILIDFVLSYMRRASSGTPTDGSEDRPKSKILTVSDNTGDLVPVQLGISGGPGGSHLPSEQFTPIPQ